MWYNIPMKKEERMDYAADRKRSMNCCQAVLVSFAEEIGQDEAFLVKLGSGFGSGMAMMEGTCGAFVGAIGSILLGLASMALGYLLARQ